MRRNILFNILSYEKEYFIQYFALFRPILNIQNDSVLDYAFEIFKHLQNPFFYPILIKINMRMHNLSGSFISDTSFSNIALAFY